MWREWQWWQLRILESTEVHILPTANPDGWNRAEEGLCGGQVSLEFVLRVARYVFCIACSVLCVLSFVFRIMSCAGLVFLKSSLHHSRIVLILFPFLFNYFAFKLQHLDWRSLSLHLRTSTVGGWMKTRLISTGFSSSILVFRWDSIS